MLIDPAMLFIHNLERMQRQYQFMSADFPILRMPFNRSFNINPEYNYQSNFYPRLNFNMRYNFQPNMSFNYNYPILNNFQPNTIFSYKPNYPVLDNMQNNIFKTDFTATNKPVLRDYAKEFEERTGSITVEGLAQKYGQANADKIKNLSSEMQVKTRLLLDYAKSKGLNITITSGYRTQAQQADLIRRKPNLAAKNSLHCQGKAIDISISSGKDSDYKLLADYAKSIGMRWGGDFKKVKERWHFDLGWA